MLGLNSHVIAEVKTIHVNTIHLDTHLIRTCVYNTYTCYMYEYAYNIV